MYKLLRALPLFGLTIFFVSGGFLSLAPNVAHALDATVGQAPAAPPQVINEVDLTTANGWTCNSTKSNCTNTDPAKGTVSCDYHLEGRSDNRVAICTQTFPNGETSTGITSTAPSGQQVDTVAQPGDGDNAKADACNTIFSLSCLLSGVFSLIAKIATFILGLVAAILGLANYLLGWSTYITVYQFGNLIGNSQGLLDAWGVLRDVANIVLLFGFIFMGISTILNLSHSEYTAKRALPTLIIFALLLNFSLLASEGVIDISNAIATSIYNQAGGTCDASQSIDCITDKGIGGKIMDMAGVGSAFGGAWFDSLDSGPRDAIIIVGLTIFLLITALVIFAAAIMLIIRAVILGFLMVTSPIGFAGMAIPPLHEVAKTWWSQLLAQAFFAPIYFLLVFVGLKVMEGIATSLNTTGSINDATLANVFINTSQGGGSSNVSIGITFALLIGFMIAALMFAKRSSAIGTGFAIKGAGGLAFGTLGWAGRSTVGQAGYKLASRINSSGFGRTRLGTFAVNNLNKVGKGSFDVRGSKAGGALADAVGNLGTPQKGGFAAKAHDREKAQIQRSKDLRNTAEENERKAEIEDTIDPKTGIKIADGELTQAKNAVAKAEKEHKEKLAELQKELDEAKAETIKTLVAEKDFIDTQKIKLDGSKDVASALRTKAAEATVAGDTEKAARFAAEATKMDTEIQTLQKALNASTRAYDEQIEAASTAVKEKITQENTNHEQTLSERKNRVTELTNELKRIKDQPKRDFAATLHTPALPGEANRLGDHHASDEILKELNKGETQKLLDALGTFKKDIDHDGGHDDKSAPPPGVTIH